MSRPDVPNVTLSGTALARRNSSTPKRRRWTWTCRVTCRSARRRPPAATGCGRAAWPRRRRRDASGARPTRRCCSSSTRGRCRCGAPSRPTRAPPRRCPNRRPPTAATSTSKYRPFFCFYHLTIFHRISSHKTRSRPLVGCP